MIIKSEQIILVHVSQINSTNINSEQFIESLTQALSNILGSINKNYDLIIETGTYIVNDISYSSQIKKGVETIHLLVIPFMQTILSHCVL